MYEDPLAKKTIHNGILLAGLMSHSFVSNNIEGFVIKNQYAAHKEKRYFLLHTSCFF
jgi:hypothetical protein